jgi:hypothetical protein
VAHGLLWVLLCSAVAFPQVELVRDTFFPAEAEFKELLAVLEDRTYSSIGDVAALPYGHLLSAPAFRRGQARTYDVAGGAQLRIEVMSLTDSRAAYSLLSLARGGPLEAGVLGDGFAPEMTGFSFCRGSRWVRISGTADPLLMQRVGNSVANRIGGPRGVVPAAVKHLPASGLEEDSIRYFTGPTSFPALQGVPPASRLALPPDVEIASARYAMEGWTGRLTVMSFPTAQVAEEFLDRFSREADPSATGSGTLFTRRSGPLALILEAGSDPRKADELLGKVRYSYSVRWIYDRRNQSGATVWGVPVAILGTVVRSLALTALLCLGSIIAGLGIASFRVWLRGYAPNNFLDRPERTELIRLKLNEK